MKASDIIGKFRFTRSSDSGGSGGGVSDLVEGSGFITKSVSGYNQSINPNLFLFLDKNIFISYSVQNPDGGTNSLLIKKLLEDGTFTTLSSISLYFGISYTSIQMLSNVAVISPNKDFVVVTDKSSNIVYVVPIIKNGENYLLGTPVEYNTFGSYVELSNPVMISDNEFALGINDETDESNPVTAIQIFKFENGTITLSQTLQTNIKPVYLKFADNKFLTYTLTNLAEIVRMDGTTKSLSMTTSNILKTYMMENFVVFLPSNLTNSIIVDLKNEEIVNMDKSGLTQYGIYTNNSTVSSDKVLKLADNKFVILDYSLGSNQPVGFIFDFTENKITNSIIINNFPPTVLGSSTYSSFYALFLGDGYACYVNTNNKANFNLFSGIISLKYQGNTYQLVELGE